MNRFNSRVEHAYRLVLAEDGEGSARVIEFEAPSADRALLVADRQCAGREAELFEDGRSLGRLRNRKDQGFWFLSARVDPARIA